MHRKSPAVVMIILLTQKGSLLGGFKSLLKKRKLNCAVDLAGIKKKCKEEKATVDLATLDCCTEHTFKSIAIDTY